MSIYENKEKLITYRPAAIYKNKSGWAIRYYVLNPNTERLHRKQIKLNRIENKTERLAYAKQLCFELNRRLANGWNPFFEQVSRNASHTFREAVDAFILNKRRDLRPATLRSYTSLSSKFVTWCEENKQNQYIFTFSHYDARQCLDALYKSNSKISSKTYNNYLKFLRLMFGWFVEREYLKVNPIEGIKVKRTEAKKRIIIPLNIRENIKSYLGDDPFYYICLLVYKCFLRPKEITMLKMKHIDWVNHLLEIPAEISKNHNIRYVPIPNELYTYLEQYRDVSLDSYIFGLTGFPSKTIYTYSRISKRWDKLRTALNLPMEYQLYSLKDTGITEMLEAGVPAKLVQELADHHSLEMTQKYVHKSNVKEILKYDVLRFKKNKEWLA